MTDIEYFEKHIPHRINLLVTFRERFADLPEEKRQKIRDLFRCSKDISLLMARFLLNELGIKLKKGDRSLTREEGAEWKKRIAEYKLKSLELSDLLSNKNLCEDVLIVLIAANRAVAHIDEKHVDHNLKTVEDEPSLIRVINYIENTIKINFYEFTNRHNYNEIMSYDYNEMHRDRFVI
ncbi:MAG: hypothetical protein J0L87_01755 [Bacteroidetes bacterium]|nr:hypothetical protein [Bacteroidota bacterium]